MDKKLEKLRVERNKFAELCKQELLDIIEAIPTKELKFDPDKDNVEILVYHENEDQTRSHTIVAIGLDTDRELLFTDKFGDTFGQTELNYTSETYPNILEVVYRMYSKHRP